MENYTFNIAKFLNQHESTIRFTVIFETNIKDLFLSDQKKKKKKRVSNPTSISENSNTQSWFRENTQIHKDQQITHKNQPESNCIAIRSEKSEKSPLKTATYLQQNKEKETIYNTRIRYDRAKKAVKIHETPRKRGKLKWHGYRDTRVYIIRVTHFSPYSSETLIKNALHASGDFILSFVSPFVYVSQIVHRRQKEGEESGCGRVGYCEVAIHRGCPFNFACLQD